MTTGQNQDYSEYLLTSLSSRAGGWNILREKGGGYGGIQDWQEESRYANHCKHKSGELINKKNWIE